MVYCIFDLKSYLFGDKFSRTIRWCKEYCLSKKFNPQKKDRVRLTFELLYRVTSKKIENILYQSLHHTYSNDLKSLKIKRSVNARIKLFYDAYKIHTIVELNQTIIHTQSMIQWETIRCLQQPFFQILLSFVECMKMLFFMR